MDTARVFLNGIIDYAGLFPPARLRMDDAVREFARHSNGPDSDLLGRFVVPASCLSEFSAAAGGFMGDKNEQWHLSAILAPGKDSALEEISQFNGDHSHAGKGIVVDAVEIQVTSVEDVDWAIRSFGGDFAIFLEPADAEDPGHLLAAISGSGASAKLRTGGIVPGAVPSATTVMRFIDTCARLSLRFKATAGLHHALRGDYPLTYDDEAPNGTMFGYLNIFLVAAFHRAGLPESALFDLLEERDSSSITFDESGAWWRGNLADRSSLADARKSLAVSFGSCSFTEPVEEAKVLHLI